MDLIGALVIGMALGALADLFMGYNRDPGSVIIAMLLGIAGSIVGNSFGRVFGWYGHRLSGPGIIMSMIGATALLVIYVLVSRRRKW